MKRKRKPMSRGIRLRLELRRLEKEYRVRARRNPPDINATRENFRCLQEIVTRMAAIRNTRTINMTTHGYEFLKEILYGGGGGG